MAQATTITVNDRAAVPVAHVFAPRRIESGLASFVESNSVPIGEKNLTIRWRKSGTRYFQRITLTVPALVTEVINGVNKPSVPRVALIDATFRFDDTSSEQERKDAVGLFANALASGVSVVDGTITKLEGIW